MPRRITRPLALVLAVAVGTTSCRRAGPPPDPAPPPPTPVSMKIDAAVATLLTLGQPPAPAYPTALPAPKTDPDQPVPPVPAAPSPRAVGCDSYEEFCVRFYATTGKTWDAYRAELAGVRAEFQKATTEKHDPPDFRPVQAMLAGLRADEARHSVPQKAAVADTTARLGEYQANLAAVDTLLKGATGKVLPDLLAAATAMETAVEEIKQKHLGRAAIRAHLEEAFAPGGSVGAPLARIGQSRVQMNTVLVGLRAALSAVKPAWERLDASFTALKAAFPTEPAVELAVAEFKTANQKWWETTEARIVALFNPLMLLLILLLSLFGGGGEGGGGGAATGAGRGRTPAARPARAPRRSAGTRRRRARARIRNPAPRPAPGARWKTS
ncbi:MAG TPA: hypothetical protein VD866_11550 [Urbifossiella sp.]|nr:hypothetical protein [Urbifossiella sp.]